MTDSVSPVSPSTGALRAVPLTAARLTGGFWGRRQADHSAGIAELAGPARRAQAPDGYLSTAYGRPGQPPRYHDLNFGHELYCAGHLLQAAVAAARTGGCCST